jgi:hypothetical protein
MISALKSTNNDAKIGKILIHVINSPFCVQAKIIKLVGLKNDGRLSPIILVTFACKMVNKVCVISNRVHKIKFPQYTETPLKAKRQYRITLFCN